MTRFPFLGCLALVSALLGCAPRPAPACLSCRSDVDCSEGRTCLDGRCVASERGERCADSQQDAPARSLGDAAPNVASSAADAATPDDDDASVVLSNDDQTPGSPDASDIDELEPDPVLTPSAVTPLDASLVLPDASTLEDDPPAVDTEAIACADGFENDERVFAWWDFTSLPPPGDVPNGWRWPERFGRERTLRPPNLVRLPARVYVDEAPHLHLDYARLSFVAAESAAVAHVLVARFEQGRAFNPTCLLHHRDVGFRFPSADDAGRALLPLSLYSSEDMVPSEFPLDGSFHVFSLSAEPSENEATWRLNVDGSLVATLVVPGMDWGPDVHINQCSLLAPRATRATLLGVVTLMNVEALPAVESCWLSTLADL